MKYRPILPTRRLTLTVSVGFALSLLLLATLTIVGLREMAELNDRLEAIVKVNNVKTRLASDMRDLLRDRAISMLSIVVMSESFDKDEEMMRFYEFGSAYQKARLTLEPLLMLPEEREVLQGIDAITRENRPIMTEVVDLGMQGYTFLAFEILQSEAIPLQRRLVNELDRLILMQRAMSEYASAEASAAFRKTRLTMLVLGLSGAGIALLVAFVVLQRTRHLAADMDRERTKFRTLFETNTDGIVILDRHGFKECNPATLDMFRMRSVDDFLRCRPEDLGAPVQPDGRSAHDAAMAGIRQAFEQGHATMQWLGRRSDGSTFPVEIDLHAMTLDGRLHLQAIMRDVTAQKAAEAALQEAHDVAVATTRLKSQFLANVSHEIRTPLNGIIGMTRLLLGTPLDERQRDYAETVSRSAESLLAIINDLLDFSKIEAGRLTVERIPFQLDELLQDVLALQAPRAQAKGLSLVVDRRCELPEWLLGDPLRVRQILLNLVDNAIKFTAQGEVRIIVEPARLPAGEGYRFTVSDTGIGIPTEAQSRIFEAFAQADGSTSRRYGGTGLGLAICRQLAELMQGRLMLDSQPGAGSAFHLDLPLPVTEAPVEQSESMPDLPHFCNTRVLVAEDNPVNQKLTRLMLENLGVEVLEAHDGRAAWELVRQEPLDLVLMDCHMPELDGLQATRAIRAWEADQGLARLPIIALTANAMPGFEETCRQAGMDGYLLKPLREEGLARTLAHWLPDKAISATPPASAKSPQAAVSACFDMEKIRRVCRDDAAQVQEMLALFINSSQPLLAGLRQACAARQAEQAARLSHQLKGAAAYIGAEAMTLAARCAEGAAKAQAWDRLQTCLTELETAFEGVRAEMERQLKPVTASSEKVGVSRLTTLPSPTFSPDLSPQGREEGRGSLPPRGEGWG
jgi:PAS domain S-box-containing protein